jgi:hypothetical protein
MSSCILVLWDSPESMLEASIQNGVGAFSLLGIGTQEVMRQRGHDVLNHGGFVHVGSTAVHAMQESLSLSEQG